MTIMIMTIADNDDDDMITLFSHVRRPNSRLKTQVLSARFTSLFAVANTKETNKKTGASNKIVIEN